jgi:hypothetical protein
MGKTSTRFSATEFLHQGFLYQLLQNISGKFASEFENKVQWFGNKTLFVSLCGRQTGNSLRW